MARYQVDREFIVFPVSGRAMRLRSLQRHSVEVRPKKTGCNQRMLSVLLFTMGKAVVEDRQIRAGWTLACSVSFSHTACQVQEESQIIIKYGLQCLFAT